LALLPIKHRGEEQSRDLEGTAGKIIEVKDLRWFSLAEYMISINADSVLGESKRVFKVRELRAGLKMPGMKVMKMVRE